MDLGGWRTGSELQHITSWQKKNNVFYIPNSVPQECCNFHLSCNLCFYGELSVNDVFLLTGTHIIPFLSVSASFSLVPPKPTQMTSGCWENIAVHFLSEKPLLCKVLAVLFLGASIIINSCSVQNNFCTLQDSWGFLKIFQLYLFIFLVSYCILSSS